MTLQNYAISINNLETQIGHLFNILTKCDANNFSTNTIPNPNKKMNAIVLRSGKELKGQQRQERAKTHNEEHDPRLAKTIESEPMEA